MLLALYSRAMESRSKEPHLRDPVAEEALSRIDYDFEQFKPNSMETLQVVLRAKQLDLWTTEFIFGSMASRYYGN
jgi:O-methyltransferase involved in polyketide biosynthesis